MRKHQLDATLALSVDAENATEAEAAVSAAIDQLFGNGGTVELDDGTVVTILSDHIRIAESGRSKPKMRLHYADGTTLDVTPTKDYRRVRRLRRQRFVAGSRVQLMALAVNLPAGYDDRPNLPPGIQGTVVGGPGGVTDDAGSLQVEWDNGSTLTATVDDLVMPV